MTAKSLSLALKGLAALGLWLGVWVVLAPGSSWADPPAGASYVGSQACKECHEDQFENYQKYSQKAHSYQSVAKMAKGLTEAELKTCYECHTTGYNKPGGFVSASQTPHMKDAGCEVCHGPGSAHKESQDPKDIRAKLSIEVCESCHSQERVAAFNYRPIIYGGGH